MAETSTAKAKERSMEADIISTLPNSLLCHILSFLPTFDAVGTGFLSRRWRHLWKDLHAFNFDDRCIRSKVDYKSVSGDCVFDSIFRCDSLVSLYLVGGFNLSNIPCVHLPLLKNLKLAPVVSVDPKLISSCPSLEDLYFLYSGGHYPNINLVSPSLKSLRVDLVKFFG
ncbi:hypothetical protein PIB30_015643 [Stylosanthes scabra]|uniref:F-box domain-containing protein n=1 Tax=Stylosanthes scabra TaxID=79078 RepID=A0ABU6T920_9FABA|nr:hypothetical protein [Stylosanthes scabra]